MLMIAGILGVIVGVVLILPEGVYGYTSWSDVSSDGRRCVCDGVDQEPPVKLHRKDFLMSFFSEGRFCRSDGWGEEEQYRYNNKPGYGDQGKDNPKDQRTYDNYSA